MWPHDVYGIGWHFWWHNNRHCQTHKPCVKVQAIWSASTTYPSKRCGNYNGDSNNDLDSDIREYKSDVSTFTSPLPPSPPPVVLHCNLCQSLSWQNGSSKILRCKSAIWSLSFNQYLSFTTTGIYLGTASSSNPMECFHACVRESQVMCTGAGQSGC